MFPPDGPFASDQVKPLPLPPALAACAREDSPLAPAQDGTRPRSLREEGASMNCQRCTAPLGHNSSMQPASCCKHCGHYNMSPTGAPEASEFVDVLSVEATSVQRIKVGEPWDTIWGGLGSWRRC